MAKRRSIKVQVFFSFIVIVISVISKIGEDYTVKPPKWLILGLDISKNRHFQVTIKNRHLRGLLVIWAFLQGLTL